MSFIFFFAFRFFLLSKKKKREKTHFSPPQKKKNSRSRAERVARFREKRARRSFTKTIRYESRRAYADVRPRFKGRFASKEEVLEMKAAAAAAAAAAPAPASDATAAAAAEAVATAEAAAPAPLALASSFLAPAAVVPSASTCDVVAAFELCAE